MNDKILTPDYEIRQFECKENHLMATLFLPETLVYFDGHFDEFPILAGVVQLDWVMKLAKTHFKIEPCTVTIPLLKFMNVIRPETEIDLDITCDKQNHTLEFTYHKADIIYSRGKIKFTVL